MAEGFGSIDAVDAATLFAATGSFRTIQLTSTLLPGLNKSMLAALPFADEPTAMLERPSHSLFGNPVRSRPGPVPIELDDALRSLPGLWSKAQVSTYAAPAILHYGYSLWPRKPSAAKSPWPGWWSESTAPTSAEP